MGHIKFWSMAHTFTGLKLQGEIGKFGRAEISDVVSFAELPNGRVVSTSEFGHLLLWDENSIKREIYAEDQQLCHKGAIDVVFLQGNEILTGGVDGFIRGWDIEALDSADISKEASQPIHLKPTREIFIGENVKVGICLSILINTKGKVYSTRKG